MKQVRRQEAERTARRGSSPERAQATEPPPATLPTFTAADLMRMVIPPPRWAVGTILPEGLTCLAGKPKLGKSWLALHLCLAVSAGGVALGKISVQAGDVLYISLEDRKRRLQTRIRKLLGPDAQPSARLHLAHDWPRMDRGGLDLIAQWREAHPQARLVIIDTWAKFRPVRHGKTDAYEIDYTDGTQVKALADSHNVSILIVHHCRKLVSSDALEEVSGSVGLTGACDGILVLRRERGQHDATLMVTGRDVEESELALCFARENCLWQLVGAAEDYRLSKERTEIVNVLRDAGRPLSPVEVAALLGKKRDAVKLLLWKMGQDGQVEFAPDGKYQSRRDAVTPITAVTAETTDTAETDPGFRSPQADNRPGNRDDEHKTPWG